MLKYFWVFIKRCRWPKPQEQYNYPFVDICGNHKMVKIPLTDMQVFFVVKLAGRNLYLVLLLSKIHNAKKITLAYRPFHREKMGSQLLVETSRNPECPKVSVRRRTRTFFILVLAAAVEPLAHLTGVLQRKLSISATTSGRRIHFKATCDTVDEELSRNSCVGSLLRGPQCRDDMKLISSACRLIWCLLFLFRKKCSLMLEKSGRMSFPLTVGGSGEHHCEPRHSQGLCVQELQPAARGALPLPRRFPAPALAGHPGLISSPWLFPGVQVGKWSPSGQ